MGTWSEGQPAWLVLDSGPLDGGLAHHGAHLVHTLERGSQQLVQLHITSSNHSELQDQNNFAGSDIISCCNSDPEITYKCFVQKIVFKNTNKTFQNRDVSGCE